MIRKTQSFLALFLLAIGFLSCHAPNDKNGQNHLMKVILKESSQSANTLFQQVSTVDGVVQTTFNKDRKHIIIQFNAADITPKALIYQLKRLDAKTQLVASVKLVRIPISLVNGDDPENPGSEAFLIKRITEESPAVKLPNIFELLPGFSH